MEPSTPEPLSIPSENTVPLASETAQYSSPSTANDDKAPDGLQAVVVGLSYLLFVKIAGLIPNSSIAVVVLTTLLSLPILLLFTVRVARALRRPGAIAASLLVSGLLIAPSILIPVIARSTIGWPGWRTIAPGFQFYMKTLHAVTALDGLLLIWFAASLGALVSRLVRETKILLPMAVALACVDLYVVFGGGLVTQAQSGKSPVAKQAMQALTVKLPTTSKPPGGAAPMQLAIGFADFLFIALFFACFARFGIPSRRTFIALCVVLAAYMGYVALTDIALPALVPIAVVVIGMNLREFRYERSEAFALLYAGLIVAAVAGGFYFFSHR